MDINFDQVIQSDIESKHSMLFPKNIFMLIVGSTGSGKTNLLLNLLLNEANHIYYDDLYLWSPTLFQPKYKFLRTCTDNIEEYMAKKHGLSYKVGNYFTQDDDLLDPKMLDETKTHLMIFDDVQNQNQSRVKEYFCSGRHNNFNVFYLCQSLNGVKKHGIRENANIFILFRLNEKTLKSFYESHASSDMPFLEFKDFCENSWKNKHGYVVINLWSQPDDKKYIANYNKVYIPDKYHKIS